MHQDGKFEPDAVAYSNPLKLTEDGRLSQSTKPCGLCCLMACGITKYFLEADRRDHRPAQAEVRMKRSSR